MNAQKNNHIGNGIRLSLLVLAMLAGCDRIDAAQEVETETAQELDSSTDVVSEIDGMTLLYIPGGLMGKNEKMINIEFYLDDFYIDQTEVSNEQYRLCVEAGECEEPEDDEYYGDSQFNKYPVVYVSWSEAQDYCQWAGRELPTDTQWEKAAQGTDQRIYPWGDTFDGELLNFCDTNCENYWRDENWNDGNVQLAPVGSYKGGASPYGVLDMAGNVSEWVADWYSGLGEEAADYMIIENPTGPNSGEYKIIRGGSWYHSSEDTQLTKQNYISPQHTSNSIGFRCAVSKTDSSKNQAEEQTLSFTTNNQYMGNGFINDNVLSPNKACKIAFSSDRDGDDEIFIMDPDGSNQTQLTFNDSDDVYSGWSPDGKKIAFYSYDGGDGEIYVMDVDGGNLTQLTDNNDDDYASDLSPDGKYLAFVSDRDGDDEIYKMSIDGSDLIQLTDNDDWRDDYPAWSPSGDQIAFVSYRSDEPEIFIMDSDGSNQTQLTFLDDYLLMFYPTWSPDGKSISFSAITQVLDICSYLMDSDGENQMKISSSYDTLYPEWSPDGKTITYGVFRDKQWQVYKMDADRSNPTQFIDIGAIANSQIKWSPDGKYLTFSSNQDGDAEIFIAEADGSNPTQLTFNDSNDQPLYWSPLCITK